MERQQESERLVIPTVRLPRARAFLCPSTLSLALLSLPLMLPACGGSGEESASAPPTRAKARERLSVLVGRRGPIVFLVYPKAWGAGYEEAALDVRAQELGVPKDRAIYEVLAVHTGLRDRTDLKFDFDPQAVELVLTRREQVISRGAALATTQPTSSPSPVQAPLWLAWCGPSGELPAESLARWTFLLDIAEPPRDLEGAPVEGRLSWRSDESAENETAEPIWLSTWLVEEAALHRHLRAPSTELLRVAEIKNAFRGDPRSPRRG